MGCGEDVLCMILLCTVSYSVSTVEVCTFYYNLRRNLDNNMGEGDRGGVAQCLRCCATNRKVAGSIPASVSGFFIDIKSFRSHYVPGVDSTSNRNEYQEHFLGVKAAGA